MSSLYQSQYNGNITDIQNTGLRYLDINWVKKCCKHSDFPENCIYCDRCQTDTAVSSSKMCKLKIENGMSGNIIRGSQLNSEVSDKRDSTNG